MACVQEEKIKIKGGEIPIRIIEKKTDEGILYSVEIDGVEWFCIQNRVHVAVLFNLMKDHITEYMHYEMTKK